MISTNLQEVSLEYDVLQWNKTKQVICILKKNNFYENSMNNIDSLNDNPTVLELRHDI